ncbi:YacL family protein [Conservatibacter flavescens]|uniref:Uncharacterized protein n=1 Tax=Conservatibacter flavescens TaxID=28161 RepID=A0A2M8S5U8_9PAST|nr:YacL family protein [Conservatibacter flavescens]PJG86491.1 hypothetical protein CVP05_01415 [Conservatibacter flavescens]
MDFQFTFHLGNVIAKCSMEHEAMAYWLNTEVRSNPDLVFQVLEKINQLSTALSAQEYQFIGTEYSLYLNEDEAMVKANHLAIEDNEQPLEQDFYYYDAESIAFCGLNDLEHFLQSYLQFIR